MTKKSAEFGVVLVSVFLFSYAANFIWESFHAVFLYDGQDFYAEKYIRMISYVAGVDGLLILAMYLFMAVGLREMLWLQEMNKKQGCAVFLLGMVIAAMIEYRKVFLVKAWKYSPLMPTIFGIGLSPLLQLSMTGTLALWLTRRLLYQKGVFYKGP